MGRYSYLGFFCMLIACHKVSQDSLPPSVSIDSAEINARHTVYYGPSLPSAVNIRGFFPKTDAHDILIKQAPLQGELEVLNENYLLFKPSEGIAEFNKDLLLIADPEDPNHVESISLIPLAAPPDPNECLVVEGTPTYLSVPLKFEIKKGESLEFDFLDLFCGHYYTGSGGVNVNDFEDYASSFLHIHIAPSVGFTFTAKPPKDFVGTEAFLLELCSGLPQSNDFVGEPQNCNWFLYTVVQVEVSE